jgi:TPR repeat protein
VKSLSVVRHLLSACRVRTLLICTIACTSQLATAGFEEALKAYSGKDFGSAISQAQQAASNGDPRALFLLGVMHEQGLGMAANPTEAAQLYGRAAQGGVRAALSRLAQLYARGVGVQKDGERALQFARQAAKLDDVEGRYLVYSFLKVTHLAYLDKTGKVDEAKYRQLATRPVADRALDTEAQDNLYRAAQRGHPIATLTLAIVLSETLGQGNAERMLELVAKVPKHGVKSLDVLQRAALHAKGLGQTMASPRVFLDAQATLLFAGMLATCGVTDGGEGRGGVELIRTAIAREVNGAAYLLSEIPEYERAYLVNGDWEEDWTYRGCDRTGTVRVRFVADGYGGATFSSTRSGADIPGLGK